ncbi:MULTISPECIES: polymorphic toxin-type HINT domain-containing protein [unclassified Nonomuraea]|uniref:polymorphic toxin-type HINT domain-containing protein n=1 Tax=unclassified Nonomuraea TaxID=2593643 RepID=UPI0033D41A12
MAVLLLGLTVPEGLIQHAAASAPSQTEEPSVPGRPLTVRKDVTKGDEEAKPLVKQAKSVWPKPGTAEVSVPTAGNPVALASLPVKVGPPRDLPAGIGATPARNRPLSRTEGTPKNKRARKAVAGENAKRADSSIADPATDPVTKVKAETFDDVTARRLGGVGLALRLARNDGGQKPGRLSIAVDYSGFRDAYGGGFASRLSLVELPACVLDTTPSKACAREAARKRRVLPVFNDVLHSTLTAEVNAAPSAGNLAASGWPDSGTVYTVASTASSTASDGTGSFEATDLKSSGSWQVGPSSGDFSYSYPIPVPPGPSGTGPKLSLEYSSAALDGLTGSTNNQASWAGLGWDLGAGFIERTYYSCPHDTLGGNHRCWNTDDDLTLSIGGRSSRIVKDATSGAWKTVEDLGWKINYVASGADSGFPYWTITAQDGTTYRLGYHRDSSWQVPYLGQSPDAPCYDKSTLEGTEAFCRFPYRWMVDQEIDPKGNIIDYTYAVEENDYCLIEPDFTGYCYDNGLTYDRGGYLAQVAYGANSNVTGSKPTHRLVFNVVDRENTNTGYSDVPTDLVCPEIKCAVGSPSFFVMKWLDTVVTQSWNTQTNAWDDVSRVELGRGGADVAWLDTIRFVGLAGNGPDAAMPAVQFDGVYLDNRNNYDADTRPRIRMLRIAGVDNGLGGRSEVRYGQPSGCGLTTSTPAVDRDDSGWDCYWTDEGSYTDINGKYHFVGSVYNKWLVTQTTDKDLVGGSPDVMTRYRYLGSPAWGSPLANYYTDSWCAQGHGWPPDFVCDVWGGEWTQFRGYPTVRVFKGSGDDPAGYSVTTSSFFRGLYDETLADGTPRRVTLTDFDGTIVNDLRSLTGRTLQEQTWRATTTANESPILACVYPEWVDSGPQWFPKAAGQQVSHNGRHWQAVRTTSAEPGTSTDWTNLGACPTITLKAPSAFTEEASTRYEYQIVVTGDGPDISDPHQVNQTRQVAREKVPSGWRYTETKTTYNADGLPIKVNDYGERGVATDNSCAATTYARNTSSGAWMISYPASQERRTGDDCAAGTLLGRTITLYDGATSETSNTPKRGNVTEVRSYTSSSEFTTAKATFDGYGRKLSATDPMNKTTTISYTPTVGWPTAGVTVTNPLGHTATTWTSPQFSSVVGIRDANGRDVNIDYDALGRAAALWTPAQPRSSGTPAATISYAIPTNANGTVNGPARTVVSQLVSGSGTAAKYVTTYSYDDGLGRERESQIASPIGGRAVSVTTYDTRGLTATKSSPVYNAAQPGSGLLNPALTSLPQWSKAVYDGLEQVVAQVDMALTTETRRTTTAYFGNRNEITPAIGGKTVRYTDAGDQVIKVEEWKDSTIHFDTAYEHDLNGGLTKQIDANGNVRTFSYDLLGRRLTGHDPDAGDLQQSFDAAGRLIWSKNGNGQKTSYTYDDLGRKTSQWAGDPNTGTKLAAWIFDTVSKGQLTSATRYVNGQPYTDTITSYDSMDRPTASTLTIPSVEGLLAGSYDFTTSYTPSGAVAAFGMPAAAGLPAEKVTSTYTDLGLPYALSSDLGTYIKATTFSPTGQLAERSYGNNGQIKRALTWDNSTGWLTRVTTSAKADTPVPVVTQDDQFFYDAAGEVTRILDAASAVSGSTVGQSECFSYDGLHRLERAYTTTGSSCTASPDSQGIDPYNHTYAYDGVGNIISIDDNGQNSAYRYPAPGPSSVRPNAVTSIDRPAGTDTYSYDNAGQLTSRSVGGKQSTLAWNELGQLEKTTVDGNDTTMVYDADGDRLIRRGSDKTVLYLGNMEIELTDGRLSGKRYYASPDGATVAMRTVGEGVTWMMSGLHGSTQLAINDATGKVSRERYLSYGKRRGGDDLPFTDRGFLGKTEDDNIGFTLLDARYYDASIAKFISTDPLLELSKPQWANPYSYAGNNPIGMSDPTGLSPCVQADYKNPRDYRECKEWEQRRREQQRNCKNPHSKQCQAWRRRTLTTELDKEADRIAEHLSPQYGFALACGNTGADGPVEYVCSYSSGKDYVAGFFFLFFPLDGIDKCLGSRDTGSCFEAMLDAVPATRLARYGKRYKEIVCNSFVPGTLVLMVDGSRKRIEDVRVGDQVIATDPETGKTEAKPVVALIAGEGSKKLVQLTIDIDGVKGDATGIVIATAGHPLWAADVRRWVDADDLRPGMILRTASNGYAEVKAVRAWTAVRRVYNLTVSDIHTYHVAAGSVDILVHNAAPCGGRMASAIGDDSYLTRAAQEAGRSNQKDLDHLFNELSKGNMNPGKGNGYLTGTDVSYGRAENGGRLFFRKVGNTIVIVGKANKKNESKVIARLQRLYAK